LEARHFSGVSVHTINEDALIEDIYEEVNYVADKLFE